MALAIDPAANPVVTRERAAAAPTATDFKQFAALRRGAEANDPKTLREVARQFESIFTKMVLSSMRQASFGDSLLGSDQVDQYQGMMDDQLAVQLSHGRGLGLADMLVRQLQGGVSDDPAAGAADAAGTASGDTSNKVSPEQKQKFMEGLLPQATAAARELGVDPRSIIAQAALETGWGTHQPADATRGTNNLFGIKATAAWQGDRVASETTEFSNGNAGREPAQFRAYGSVAENVADYVGVIRDNPRYAAALGTGSDVRAFANALQRGGYATDPGYADKLVSIAEQLGVTPEGRTTIAADVPRNVKGFKLEPDSPISDPRKMNNG
jgi:peptidoglycan hydrolase FlgJ